MAVEDNRELHVLAVDDSLVDRKVIERLLKISRCKVTAVESGTRALQYLGLDGDKDSVCLDDLKVNMIITDYSMPGMTGYELLKKIKQGSSKLREIPVVVMSSENVLSNIDRCLEGGAEEFLVKPVKLADVQRLRDFVLSGEKCAEKTAPSRKRKTCEDLSFCVPKLGSPQSPLDRDTSLSPTPVPAAHQQTLGSPQSPLDRDISLSPTPVPAQHQPIQKRQRIIQAD